MSVPQDWIYLPVTPAIKTAAQARRAERDAQYDNLFGEAPSDMRWLGEAGEICFNDWLLNQGVQNINWILENAAGQPDFVVNNHTIDVKTVKRNVPMRADYSAQVTARHTEHDMGSYFFTCYEAQEERLVLLGGISRAEFLAHAQYYGEGEQVQPSYTIRRGHEIYNIQVEHLVPPREWLQQVIGQP